MVILEFVCGYYLSDLPLFETDHRKFSAKFEEHT